MKAFVVDTLATVVFFTVIAGLTELFIAGLDPAQVLVTRLLTIPVMVLSGRPYGIWRTKVLRRFSGNGRLVNILADILAFLTFQVPVYVATLLVAGASFEEVQVAVSGAIVLMILLSRPFGLFLDVIRKLTGVTPGADPTLPTSAAPQD